MARSAFSTAAFAQLVRRLRHTNARYNQIALQLRCRIRPTYHAKRRAHRAGLRIDTSKARACPAKHVSTHPPPVLDLSPDPGLAWSAHDPLPGVCATAEPALGRPLGCMRGNARPDVPRHRRRRDARPLTLRLPPLKLHLGLECDYYSVMRGPVPGAPRLAPRQLPEDESFHDLVLGSVSSSPSTEESDLFLTPFDVQVYSGLCITIPPRSLKRKLSELDPNVAFPQQPKRFLRSRWDDSQKE